MKKVIDGKLAEWMLFLHKEQIDIVTGNYSGPMRVRVSLPPKTGPLETGVIKC